MESIIAKVDNHTEEIMNCLSVNIESAIYGSLQNNKNNIKDIEENIEDQTDAINTKLDNLKDLSSLMKLKDVIENSLKDVSDRLIKMEGDEQNQNKTVNEKLDKIQNDINNVFQHIQPIEYVTKKCAKIDDIEQIQNNIKEITKQNKLQFNVMKESIATIQATLDIIVNQTTPFWKKWGK